ncbi:MAG: AAA family ATPase, partial [bacterium]
MYLSSIDLFGFKSFAHRTRISFSPGLTAIVGPNGCGKSNLVDAIRWVLGEQRESALRSDRMENVIFSGSNQRRPLGMAEISLTLNGVNGELLVDYDEVTITRRLYRSGKSEYLLNKSLCRLKDLIDLIADSGVGSDAYSIIELKMVEDILSENPLELRRLFDEATGITRYKMRRKEALRRLEEARQDRERSQDLFVEIERQTVALKRQVSRLQSYQRLKEKARLIELAIVLDHTRQLDAKLAPLNDTMRQISGDLETKTAQINQVEATLMLL